MLCIELFLSKFTALLGRKLVLLEAMINPVPEDLCGLMFLAFGSHKEAFLPFTQLTAPVGLKRTRGVIHWPSKNG